MDPEEKALLERTLKLSLENNQILHKMQRAARWATVWGFIKALIIIVPLIAGYLYLQPYLNQILDNFSNVKDLLNNVNQPR